MCFEYPTLKKYLKKFADYMLARKEMITLYTVHIMSSLAMKECSMVDKVLKMRPVLLLQDISVIHLFGSFIEHGIFFTTKLLIYKNWLTRFRKICL